MEIFAIIAAPIALVWGVVLIRNGGLLAGCVAVLIAGIVFGPAFFSLPGGPMPITIDRALLGLLIVLYAAYRWLGWVDSRAMATADAAALLLIGILTCNVFSHDWKTNRSQPLSYLVFLWLMPFALYWIARRVEVTQRGLRGVFATFAVLGVYLALTAVFESKYKWYLVFPQYIVSPAFKEWLGRGRGPLLNPAGNGMLMTIGLACGLMAWPKSGRYGKLALIGLFVPVMIVGVYSTLTRSAWMGAASAALLLVAIYLPRHWRLPAIAMTLIVGTAVAGANWERLLAFKRDKELTAADAADSASLRPILAYVAYQMFWDRPVLGCGLGHYLDKCPPYLADRSIDLPVAKVAPYVQHNAVLSLLVETGLLGTTAYLILVTLWLREGWLLWRNEDAPMWQRQAGLVFLAAIAGYFPNAMFQDTTIIPMANMVMFFLAALVVNLRQTTPQNHSSQDDDRSRARQQRVERDWIGKIRIPEHAR